MRFSTKAQGSTEYLIILAVVIIIALIVVGVLGGIPGIGRTGTQRASASFWLSQDIGITSYSVKSNGQVTFNLKNNLRNSATVTAVTLGGQAVGSGNLSLSTGSTGSRTGSTSLSCTAGKPFTYAVNISYTDDATSASYNLDGDGTKLEGSCAS